VRAAAFQYLHYQGGIETEDAYPYKAVDQNCTFTPKKVQQQEDLIMVQTKIVVHTNIHI
jgi:hypothetical protein